MRAFATIGAAFAAPVVLAACASLQISPDDRAKMCPIAVVEKFEHPAVHPNPLGDPATGPLRGMVGGAGFGLWFGAGAIFVAPIGALIGTGYGSACASAAASHPAASADSEKIFRAAYETGAFGRSLTAALNGQPPECGRRATANGLSGTPRTIVEIEAFDVMMGCVFGQQEYWVAVRWRALSPGDGTVLAERTTRCAQASQRDVDAWFADPEHAQKEMERVLERVAERVALEVIAPRGLPDCRFRSTEFEDVER